MIQKKLVKERKYLTEQELLELNSLCLILPGPSSTQTITAIGFKLGGPWLAFLSLFVWILPATILMSVFVVLLTLFTKQALTLGTLKFFQPLALGFIIYAAIKITVLFAKKAFHWVLVIVAAILVIFINTPIIFPLMVVIGGIVSNVLNKVHLEAPKPIKNIRWDNFYLFIGVFLLAALLGAVTKSIPFKLFENTYRFGSIVFGGGNVLIPMMYEQFVDHRHYLDTDEFITGVGLLQAIPGPVFSFSTYAGGMAMKEWGILGQLLGCAIGTIGIFLPGIFLIFFIYPIWNQIKSYPPVQNAVEGINAVSAGFVIAAAYLLSIPIQFSMVNAGVVVATILTLFFTRIPSPVIVLIALIAGLIF